MAKHAAPSAEPDDGIQPLDQSELRKYPGYFLARARYMAFKTFDAHIGADLELRPVEFALMVLLGSNRKATQKQLSVALGVAQPNMTGVLRKLEARGLLGRTRAEKDKRMQYVTLSAAGGSLLARANAASQGMDRAWMTDLSKAEQAMLMELLEKLTVRRRPRPDEAGLPA